MFYGATALSLMTLSNTAFSTRIVSITIKNATLSITVLNTVMLSVIVPNFVKECRGSCSRALLMFVISWVVCPLQASLAYCNVCK
jgi:hypothetical protein